MTCGLACTAAGVPSAIFWPKSSTVTTSHTDITTSMWCSIRISVMPCSRILRMMTTSSLMSGAVRPAAGSSSSSSSGLSASARAISSRRCLP